MILSATSKKTSTHYVNLPHYSEFQTKLKIILDEQHDTFNWFDLSIVIDNKKFHPYVHNYARWLLKNMDNRYA